MPFNICQFCISHMDITHYALALVTLSWLFLGMVISSVVGDSSPMRALKSPTITELAFWGMHPKMSSVKLRATSSSIFLFYKFCTGGTYTFPSQIFSPPYAYMHMFWAYSFPIQFITFIPFLTTIAIPPRFPVERLCSYT
jgi:hypothetical protein